MSKSKLTSDEIASRYKSGKNTYEIAQEAGVSNVAISWRLRHLGVQIRPLSISHRKYDIDDHAFDEINESSAYWIGFIMADGCLPASRKELNTITIALSDIDAEHLVKFASFIGSTHPIAKYTHAHSTYKYARITICSKHIKSVLQSHGVYSNKSLTAKATTLYNNRDFWRGVIDGDGTVLINARGNSPQISLCGSLDLVSQYADFCRNIHTTLAQVHKVSSIYRFSAGGTTAYKIVKALYADCSIALDRKMTVARAILSDPYKPRWVIGEKKF